MPNSSDNPTTATMSNNPMQRARVSIRSSISQARRMTPRGKKERHVCHKGWLEKRGPTHDFGWQKRWCVLTEEEIDFFENEDELPKQRTGEILISEYTATEEFKKKDAPGEAAKYVKTHPFGFVVDTEPYNGPKRLGMFYLAADSVESMNQWIVAIHKAGKHLKNLAPANRTSLAEFVALWDAPIVLVSAPDLGVDKHGNSSLSVSAICKSVVDESSQRSRNTILDGGALTGALNVASGWFGASAPEEGTETKKDAFPMHKYFSVAIDHGSGHFPDTRIRTCNNTAGGKEQQVLTGRNDLELCHGSANWKGPGEYNEQARFELACENSFQFTYWRGMVIGSLLNTLVAMGDKPLPFVTTEKETRIGKMSQASAQGLRIGDAKMPNAEFSKYLVRIVLVATIDGGPVEAVQKRHIPRICKEVVKDLKKSAYPWAEDAWTVWIHFPTVVDFVNSLGGVRNLVPDNTSGRQIGEDDEDKPITYCVHRYKRQPPAPSLLGSTNIEDVLNFGAAAFDAMIEGLLEACDSGNAKHVRSILDKKCPVDAKDDAGMRAISVAAGQGHEEIVKELLMRRADANTMDSEGDTVLTVAVGEGKLDVVKLLLASGADKNVQVNGIWVDDPDTVVSLADVAKSKGFSEIAALVDKPQAVARPKAPPRAPNLADELAGLGDVDVD